MLDVPPPQKFVPLRPLALAAALSCLPLLGLAGGAGTAQAQAFIATQEPCSEQGRPCFVYRYRAGLGDARRTGTMVRGFGFKAPRAGTALLAFTGTLYCGTNSSSGNQVVDMVSQIVTGDHDIADLAGPSALRHANVFVAPYTSMTFNLASTRVIKVPAGPTIVYFVTTSLKTDSAIFCHYYDAAFSVTFIP